MEHENKRCTGTSGWSYRWREVLYPPELKSADFLAHYATRFNRTETNSSFYHFTMAKTIEKWLAQTPAHVKFAPKLNQEITHKRKFVGIEEPLQKFMSRYQLTGGRLLPYPAGALAGAARPEDSKEVWVFFNNTIVGNAVFNADTLRRMVEEL